MAKESSFAHCLDHEGFMAHQTYGPVIISSTYCHPVLQSIVSGPLTFIIESANMWHVCTVSEREEGINIFKLIDKIDIGNYNYMSFGEQK